MTDCLTPGCRNVAEGGFYRGVAYWGWRDIRSPSGSPPMYCERCIQSAMERKRKERWRHG